MIIINFFKYRISRTTERSSTMVALKLDNPIDVIFSAGGAVAAMMILHFVHVQVSAPFFL